MSWNTLLIFFTAACILASPTHNTEENFEKVVKYTEIVLELDPENDKALYRKAQALKMTKNFVKAKETLEQLIKVCSNSGKPVPKGII